MNAPDAFTVAIPGAAAAVDVFGLWQPSPAQAQSTGQAGSLWRADLPADPVLAQDLLQSRSEEIAFSQRQLPSAGQRLSADLDLLSQQSAGSSFSIPAGEEGGPRAILAAALQHQGLGVSFGLLDNVKIDPLRLGEVTQTVGSFARQVHTTIDQFAQVETSSGGHRLGVTHTSWTGDLQTWWSAGATPQQRQQHEEVLAQALATRQAWLRFLVLVASGITRVSIALASGPFAPIAIWTTWNYLQEVVKAYHEASSLAR